MNMVGYERKGHGAGSINGSSIQISVTPEQIKDIKRLMNLMWYVLEVDITPSENKYIRSEIKELEDRLLPDVGERLSDKKRESRD